MNDIYEQKAKKYKYKYLKLKRLKREIEYIGEGGMFEKVYNDFLNLFGKKTDTKAIEPKAIVYGEHHNLPASDNQKQFRQTLVKLREKINLFLRPLHDTYIIGKINNTDFTTNEKIGLVDHTQIKDSVSDTLYNKIKNIAKDPEYREFFPPIIKCFFNIDNILNTQETCYYSEKHKRKSNIYNTKKDCLIKILGKCLTSISAKSNNIAINEKEIEIDKFSGYLLENLFKKLDQETDVHYDLYIVYTSLIRQNNYEKDIDYYALTKVICDLYDTYIKDNKDDIIKENITKSGRYTDASINNLKNTFLNNGITKDILITELNNIIEAIKE